MLKKILLTGSLVSLAIGFSGVGTASQWGVTLPFGAVLLILSFIVMVLEKESALYDVEQAQIMASLTPPSAPLKVTQPSTLGQPRAAARPAF